MKTHDVLKVTVLFFTSLAQIARSLIAFCGVTKFSSSLRLRRGTSCLASGRPLHRLMDNSFDRGEFCPSSGWSTSRYRAGSSKLWFVTTFPPVPKTRLPLLRRHCVGFYRGSRAMLSPTFHGFIRKGIFLQALTMVCILFQIICATYEICPMCLSVMSDACGLMILG